MKYKIIISVECEDEREVVRQYDYNPDKDYNEEVQGIVNNLEKEF